VSFIFNIFLKNIDHITPFISTLPALLAKSSVVWSTLLYMFTNKTIKSKVLESFNFSKFKKTKNISNISIEVNKLFIIYLLKNFKLF